MYVPTLSNLPYISRSQRGESQEKFETTASLLEKPLGPCHLNKMAEHSHSHGSWDPVIPGAPHEDTEVSAE